MIDIKKLRKSKRKMQFAGQLYDVIPDVKPSFAEYTPLDKNIYFNITAQLQSQYDKLIAKKEDALKAIKDEKVHSIYNPLKQQIATEILAANDNLLKESNYDVLNPTYSQGIYDAVNKKLYGNEWMAAIGNTPQIEDYEKSKQAMLSQGNVENYDDPNINRYNEMLSGKNLYNPFTNRGIFRTPDYDEEFDGMIKNFTPDELVTFKPITGEDGSIEPFDVVKIESKIMSDENLRLKFETLRNNYFTTQAGASFARKVAKTNGYQINDDGSINYNQAGLKDKLNQEFTKMINDAAIRNQYYKEEQSITQLQGKLSAYNNLMDNQAALQRAAMDIEARKEIAQMRQNSESGTTKSSGKKGDKKDGEENTSDTEIEMGRIPQQITKSENDKLINSQPLSIKQQGVVPSVPYMEAEMSKQKSIVEYEKSIESTSSSIFRPNSSEIYTVDGQWKDAKTITQNLVDYYDKHNTLIGFKLKRNAIQVNDEELNRMNSQIEGLLVKKKETESKQSTLNQINKTAFDKLVATKRDNNNPNNPTFKYIAFKHLSVSKQQELINFFPPDTNLKDIYVDIDKNYLIRYNTDKNQIEYIAGTTANQTKTAQNKPAGIQWTTMGEIKGESYDEHFKRWLVRNHKGYISYGSPASVLDYRFSESYNHLTDSAKAELQRKFMISDDYKKYIKKVNSDVEDELGKRPAIEQEIFRNLNAASKDLTKLQISDVELVSLPNEATMPSTGTSETGNVRYFAELSQITDFITSADSLQLNVYEFNAEKDNKTGISPVDYRSFQQSVETQVSKDADSWGWDNYNVSALTSPKLLIDAAGRVDGIGGVFKGSIYYDITNVKDVGGNKDRSDINEFVKAHSDNYEIITQNKNTYVKVKNKQILINNELANKVMYEAKYGRDTADQLGKTYELVTKGFNDYNVTTLDLDAYATTSNIKVERIYDEKGNANYRVFYNDINNEAKMQVYNNLAEVAETVQFINTTSKELDINIQNSNLILNNSTTGKGLTTPQNSTLSNIYRNIIVGHMALEKKDTKFKEKKQDLARIYYDSLLTGNTLTFNNNKDNGNKYIISTAWAINNLINYSEGTSTYKDGYNKDNPTNFNLTYKRASSIQQKMIKQLYGREVDLIYNDNKLTVQDAAK